jgi:NAD+ kinase
MPEAAACAIAIAGWLQDRGIPAVHGTLDDATLLERINKGDFDLFVAVGGDGTMLRSAHLCAPIGLPILGVNLGRLGFLIQVGRDEWQAAFDKLRKGEYWIENRMMIRAEHGTPLTRSWSPAAHPCIRCMFQPVWTACC